MLWKPLERDDDIKCIGVCVYELVKKRMYISLYIYMYKHLYICALRFLCIFMRVFLWTLVFRLICTCMSDLYYLCINMLNTGTSHCIHTYTPMHVPLLQHMHVHLRIHTRTHTYTHMHMSTCICIRAFSCVTYTCTPMYMCIAKILINE